MAVECINSGIYVNKILSERRKVKMHRLFKVFCKNFNRLLSHYMLNNLRKLTDKIFLQAKKPLMEKMRRARINESLNELKGLILDLLNKDVSSFLTAFFNSDVDS